MEKPKELLNALLEMKQDAFCNFIFFNFRATARDSIILKVILDQIENFKKGNTIVFRNAKITLFKNTMRLSIDEWGSIQSFEKAQSLISIKISDKFQINSENNLSNQKYEIVYEFQ